LEYSGNKKIEYNGIHKEVKTMGAFTKKLLASLVAIAAIASLFTGFLLLGTAAGQPPTCPLDEDFSGPWPPSGWTTDDWNQSNTNYAGGTPPEARLAYYNIFGNYAYLDSKSVGTTGASSLTLEFKSFIDDYCFGGSYDCRVYTRAHGGGSWTDVTPWSNPIYGNVGPDTYSVDISSDIGSATQVRFEFDGSGWCLDYWYVDDVKICGDIPTPPSPHLKYLHSEVGLFNLTDPIGTQWHELWPFFCKEYHLSSWNDTSGDGVLSRCDWVDMYEKPDGEVKWYHVEEVTITLYLTPAVNVLIENGFGKVQLGEPMYIELEGGYNPTVLTAPNCTQWHEIYPNFCTRYHLSDWADTNSTDKLDPCDYILLIDKETENVTSWHVEDVAIDIVVTMKPPPVGGKAYPVSKTSLLAPCIAVALALAGGISWYVLRRRRAQS
jgi:hypothetical protein